jgi:hypothetical protein
MPHQRTPHYLDEALHVAIDLPCKQLPTEVARVLINLCGAVRHLERENAHLWAAMAQRPDAGALVVERSQYTPTPNSEGAAA